MAQITTRIKNTTMANVVRGLYKRCSTIPKDEQGNYLYDDLTNITFYFNQLVQEMELDGRRELKLQEARDMAPDITVTQ